MLFEQYIPEHSENRLSCEGDVEQARIDYFKKRPSNLRFLLAKRYKWMNRYIRKGDKVLEVGAGSGFSPEFIRKDCSLMVTDFADHPWLHKKVDAMKTKFDSNKFDVVLSSNMVHHLSHPKKFFVEMARILKPGGMLLIQENNASLALKAMLRILRHEGWSFKSDVYGNLAASDGSDLWSANCAVSRMLFDDYAKFHRNIPQFKIIEDKHSELFIWPLSGGVTAKAPIVNLPYSLLKIIDSIDETLSFLMPNVFAMQRRIVLKNVEK